MAASRVTPTARGLRTLARGAVLVVVVLVGGAGIALTTTVAAAPPASADDCKIEDPQKYADAPPALARLGVERAWTLATGAGITVAVVDSGVDPGNVHLVGAVVSGTELAGLGGTPTGFTDSAGHGTAIAGQIAARRAPGSGVVGLAKDAKILPVRVYGEPDAAGTATSPDRIAEGIRYAAEHGAKIINVSLSSPSDNESLHAAVQAATSRGALVVASAGNRKTTQDKSDSPRYPAAYEEVLAVTAVDDEDTVTEDSIHGPHVDVSAPGTNVATAFFAADDCLLAGADASTSFATAYVSAAAALLAERFPDESPAQRAYRLEVTASRASVGTRDDDYGWGVIRPYEALTFVDDGSAPGPPSPAHEAQAPPQAPAQTLRLGAQEDPLAPARSIASWWLLGGLVVLVGAVLASRLTTRVRRRG